MDGASLHAYGRMIAALNDDAIHSAQHADYRRTHAAREAEQWVALMNLAIADRNAMFLEAVAAADGDHERVRRAYRAALAEQAATARAIRADPDPSKGTGTKLMIGLSGNATYAETLSATVADVGRARCSVRAVRSVQLWIVVLVSWWIASAASTASAETNRFRGDGGPALRAQFGQVESIVTLPDGNVLVLDRRDGRIRRVDPNGRITTALGAAPPEVNDGFLGMAAGLSAGARSRGDLALAGSVDGTVVIIDRPTRSVYRMRPDGAVDLLVGPGTPGLELDGVAIDLASVEPAASSGSNGEIWLKWRRSPGDITYFRFTAGSSSGSAEARGFEPPGLLLPDGQHAPRTGEHVATRFAYRYRRSRAARRG